MSNVNLKNWGKPWSQKATEFLVNNAGKMSAQAIANRLGRTRKSVYSKSERVGVNLSV